VVEDPIVVAGRESQTRPRGVHLRFLVWLLVAVMGSLLGRSFYLQIWQGERFQVQAEENRVEVVVQSAPRGIIYDRHGEQLLENVASTDVVLDPRVLPDEEHEAQLFDTLPQLIDISPEDLRGKVAAARASGRPMLLQRALEHADAIAVASNLNALPGVRLISSSVRSYTYAEALAPVLGYTGLPTDEEVQAASHLLASDVVGKAGLEKHYDQRLRGRPGAFYHEVDAAGQSHKDLGEAAAIPGEALRISIDAALQRHIFGLFQARAQAQGEGGKTKAPVTGSAVVLEAKTGAIRALVSYPSFDANAFSQPARRSAAQSILHDPLQPLFNRAVAGMYPPGSTIKPLIAAAGLEEGLITPQTTWLSTGGIRVGQWFFPDWKAGGHGATNLTHALAESVNTFFYLLAGGDETRVGLGPSRLVQYLGAFNLGQPTGIDLPSEAAGLLPSPEWKEATKQEPWYIGDTYHLGIGQGDILVTPLQVAAATVAIANGGTLVQPHLFASEQEPERTRVPVAPEHLAAVRAGMREAVISGSGRRLSTLPLPVAGKTGTAQIGGSEDTHAWFTSFGPADTPELVVTVLLERGGEGDKDAVPLAEGIWQYLVEHP